MKKYLIRSQIDHNNVFPPERVILDNLAGGNIGNWLYQYSVYRALEIDENVKIDAVNFMRRKIDKKFIDRVNNEYDAFILPLANAFRPSFIEETEILTNFINGLNIPCILVCIGIQCKLNKDFSADFPYSRQAKDLINAVLNKSSVIGIRGENTAQILEEWGFKRDSDYKVIGCPSMYMHGIYLPEPKPFLYDSKCLYSYNSKVEHENKKIKQLLGSFTQEHENYIFPLQRMNDIRISYYGMEYRQQIKPKYTNRFFDPAKAVNFTSVPGWISYMHDNVDFSIGTRLHGNIAAVLGGVPSLIIANDKRVLELAQFHNIPYKTIDSIEPGTTIKQLTQDVDFSSVLNGHRERFYNFVDFLEQNGLETAYSNDRDVKEVYFDKQIKQLDFSTDCRSFFALSDEEKLKRTQNAAVFYATRLKDKSDAKKEADKKAEQKKREQAKLKKTKDANHSFMYKVLRKISRILHKFIK